MLKKRLVKIVGSSAFLNGIWIESSPSAEEENSDSIVLKFAKPSCCEFDGLDPSLSFHYAFEVDDCGAAAKRLTELGLQIVVGPRQRPDGARQVYVYDPDGHLIELCSNP